MKLSDYLTSISAFLIENAEIVLFAVFLLSIFCLLAFIILNFKLSSISRKYRELMTGVDGKNLEDLLLFYASKQKDLENKIQELQQKVELLERDSKLAIKKVYAQRYDAFKELGGNLSFSLVLLNDYNTGMLITSIFGRDENRIYLKPIEFGKTRYALSPEEQEVLTKALQAK